MPTKDSATEMLYTLLDSMAGIGVNYDFKTNTIYTDEPKTVVYDKVTVDRYHTDCASDHQCSQCENWKQKEEETKMKNSPKSAPVYGPFEIRSVLSNRKKNAFSVVWMDGTTTVVHCQPGDKWDDEKALAMCFTKKALGNKGNFNDKFNDALDNKRKVIPGSAGIIAENTSGASISFTRPITLNEEAVKKMTEVSEKECEKLTNAFGINKETASKLSKAAAKADVALKDMINSLIGGPTSKTSETKKTPLYRVFIRISGKSHHDSDFTSIEALRERVHEIAEEHYGRKPYYYRTWMNGDRMMVDFGHYTQFIEVEGITPDEYAKH